MAVFKNINYMKNFVFHPCATPNPLLLIELAFEAGAPVLWELLTADVLDKAIPAAKKMWRDTAGKAPSRGAPGTPGTPQPRGHGRRMTGKPGRKNIGIPYGTKTWLFELIDAEQTGMFYWLVADLATEFMARWTTAIYLKQGCPFDHNCYREGPWQSIFIDQGVAVPILPVLSTGVIISGGHAIQQIRKGKYSISYQAKIKRFLSDEPPSAARVVLLPTAGNAVLADGAGGGVTSNGERLSGGFAHIENTSDTLPSYFLQLINDSPTETVGVTEGHLQLSSGFCDNSVPAIPLGINSLIPQHGHH